MNIGYARVSKKDGSQNINLQVDALIESGVKKEYIYSDKMSGSIDERPGLEACLKALRSGDILMVYALDRLGRNLKHLVATIDVLREKGVGFKVIAGIGATIDSTTATGKLMFGIFATLAEFERDLIKERTIEGLKSSRAKGIIGGRRHALTKAQVRLAVVSMKEQDTNVSELCRELKIARNTLYRYVSPDGELRDYGKKVLGITD
ncbi:MAG: recombinase family protein [Sedimenticola sp.]